MYDLQEFFWALLKPETFREKMRGGSELADGESFMGPEEFEEIERFIAELDKPKTITGAELRK
jgi:hypothetical protein